MSSNENRICPRCDGQGHVLKARIVRTGDNIFVCDECDAAWSSEDEIATKSFVDFGTMMEGMGLPPYWEELAIEQ